MYKEYASRYNIQEEEKIEPTATAFLKEQSSKYPGEITLMCMAPLTNIAEVLKHDNEFGSKIKNVIIMGGSIFG
jgi:inosine-uridine nucleoside N-ribohydrolase